MAGWSPRRRRAGGVASAGAGTGRSRQRRRRKGRAARSAGGDSAAGTRRSEEPLTSRPRAWAIAIGSATIASASGRRRAEFLRCHRQAYPPKPPMRLRKSSRNWDKRSGCHRQASGVSFVGFRWGNRARRRRKLGHEQRLSRTGLDAQSPGVAEQSGAILGQPSRACLVIERRAGAPLRG